MDSGPRFRDPEHKHEKHSKQRVNEQLPDLIVNQAMVNRYWSNQDPLGKRIKIGDVNSKSPWFTVKGVVKDSAQSALDQGIDPLVALRYE